MSRLASDSTHRAAASTQTEVRRRIEKRADRVRSMKVPIFEGSATEFLQKFHTWEGQVRNGPVKKSKWADMDP